MQAKLGGCYRVYGKTTAAAGLRNCGIVYTADNKWARWSYAATSRIALPASDQWDRNLGIFERIFERVRAEQLPFLAPACRRR